MSADTHAVAVKTWRIRQIATEIATNVTSHVAFLRGALGTVAVARPSISAGTR
ncbi:hypothetical protein AAGW05_08920 [Arthrobacter sp. LAPM80]|uniref:hypothetical protein n=1 Tax=Arthrobacter sp. LAPM80 TaxID=3141788 RepID=UPI00398B82FD